MTRDHVSLSIQLLTIIPHITSDIGSASASPQRRERQYPRPRRAHSFFVQTLPSANQTPSASAGARKSLGPPFVEKSSSISLPAASPFTVQGFPSSSAPRIVPNLPLDV